MRVCGCLSGRETGHGHSQVLPWGNRVAHPLGSFREARESEVGEGEHLSHKWNSDYGFQDNKQGVRAGGGISDKWKQVLAKPRGSRAGEYFKNKSYYAGFPSGVLVENLPANAGVAGDTGSIPGSGRSPGEANGNPLQHSCLENPMDRGAWGATVHGVIKGQILLNT